MKKDFWRKHRIPCEISPIDGDTCILGIEVQVRAEEIEKNIIKIGKSVKVKLKKPIFKDTFSDLEKKDYLRESTDSRENISIVENLSIDH